MPCLATFPDTPLPPRWQCLLMPVTPSSMMPLLDAPVPFVLGVQYKTQEAMARCAHQSLASAPLARSRCC